MNPSCGFATKRLLPCGRNDILDVGTLLKFNYEGQAISFEFKDGAKMINATEMAKPFGKKIHDFLRLQGTKDYITLLEKRNVDSLIVDSQVLRVIKGGIDPTLQGTWMDE